MAKILVIEDDEALLQVLCSALDESGYDVFGAGDGTAASLIIRTQSLDLIVTDIFLPEKDGLDVIRETKKVSPGTKIIAISGGGRHDKDTYLSAAMVLGADCRLDKPFVIKALTDSVSELLSR